MRQCLVEGHKCTQEEDRAQHRGLGDSRCDLDLALNNDLLSTVTKEGLDPGQSCVFD